jgi:hypothetical protein
MRRSDVIFGFRRHPKKLNRPNLRYAESEGLVSSMMEAPAPDKFDGFREDCALCCFAEISIDERARVMQEEAEAHVR